MLEIEGIDVCYGDIQVLFGVSLTVGEVDPAVIANDAGVIQAYLGRQA